MLRAVLGLGLAVGFSTSAFAAKFSIVEKDGQVCRQESGKEDVCVTSTTKQFGRSVSTFDIMKYVRLNQAVKAKGSVQGFSADEIQGFAAADVLKPEQIHYLLKNFSEIDARHTGIKEVGEADGKKIYRVFGSVFFKGWGPSYTVQLDGELRIDAKTTMALNTLHKVAEQVEKGLYIDGRTGLSDDMTSLKDQKWVTDLVDPNHFRWLETVARYANYQIIGVRGIDTAAVDAQTIKDVTEIVAPVVFARIAAEASVKGDQPDVKNISPK